jgi:hypothetical protein
MYNQLKSRIKTKVQGNSKVALKIYNCNWGRREDEGNALASSVSSSLKTS